MNKEERIEYVKYRIESAYQTYAAAKVLAESGYWNSAFNRLYYSVFYAVKALLALNEIPSKTHSSTKSQFSLHFVKTGIFDKEYGRLFSELLDWRQKGDYDNIFDYDKYSVEPLFEPIEKMIKLIEQEIQNKLQQH